MNTPTSANPQGLPRQPAPDAEDSDVNVRGVLMFIALLVLLGGIIHLGLWLMERHLARREAQWDAQMTRDAVHKGAVRARPNFPEPRLQISPARDLKAFREREDAELNSYGWVNRTAGVVRIPIQNAMELLVRQGLPVRDPNDKGKSNLDLLRERAQAK
jgi:hypothetical protein